MVVTRLTRTCQLWILSPPRSATLLHSIFSMKVLESKIFSIITVNIILGMVFLSDGSNQTFYFDDEMFPNSYHQL